MTVPAGSSDLRRLHRRRLSNGLRVVLLPHWPTPRCAVSVHHATGFRSELPGQEGLAHLVEHLMFRGSESLPSGRFYDDLHPLGGTANGTTHADYTDYYQVVPAEALEQALFREADRLRAPAFTDGELATQLVEVGREIQVMRDSRLYGNLPWPGLPAVMFRSFANAHDGYGEVSRLADLTVDDCAAFFDAHYVPSGAVLTIVTPHAPEQVWPLVERHFGDLPARVGAASRDVAEPPPGEHRVAEQSVEGATRTAVALGYRLPDPRLALSEYAVHMVLARLTSRWRSGRAAVRASAGCGFFGPLDALTPDAFVVTSVLPDDLTPDDFVADLLAEWGRLGDSALDRDRVRRAARELSGEHRRQQAGLVDRCRALGRFELLFDRAELVEELPRLLSGTSAGQVARAAHLLAGEPRALLVAGPRAAARTTPAPAPAPVPPPGGGPLRTAAELGVTAAGPRVTPPLGEPVPPALGGAREVCLDNGLRVIAVPDHRAELAEIRLRVPLGPYGWESPDRVDFLLWALGAQTDAAGRAATLGGGLHLSQDGQWADLTGWVPVTRLAALMSVVGDVLNPGPLPPWRQLPVRRRVPPSPQQRMDEALRRRWARTEAAADPPVEMSVLHRHVFRPAGATLVVVAPADAVTVLATVAAPLVDWVGDAATPVAPGLRGDPELLVLREPGGGVVHLSLSGREPDEGSPEAARYLTTALLGGYTEARLVARCRRLGRADHVLLARRDVLAGHRRASVRLAVPREALGQAVADVRAEVGALIAEPPPVEEVEAVRRYCSAQLLSAFDSPAALADALRHTSAAGRGLHWLVRRPELLRAPRPEDLSAAAHDLFGALRHVVVLGAVPADLAAADLTG
ncbi:insulinase family protein [Micromonospora arborensis]|uniref:M16 family metallopeptidase n=1 Tax=Micromonospora arborensis TaxID=2116518 RepID=UPI0033CA5A8B